MRPSLRTTARAALGLLAALALSGAVLPAVAHSESDDEPGERPAVGSHGQVRHPSKGGFLFPLDGLPNNANVGVNSVSDRT
ncbi:MULTISPECIES: hypothetical protein [Streptomyces]|uniref:Uncharacterized protein n=2 Tax=Streptomyces rimosus subsp. rimosus TaxID=132474 RepID=L8ESG6_STRR1|nr:MULTISPECIES: hypothetical protein [Streptomyces]KOG72062.1 hypothetical protein ADK78_22335 [Kitasatospora aureofaciens]MYT42977.1 hypothetical protein [Streptomyces sp. SID5471]KEF03219.1 hypothetical protein DF17_30225 [Streptomyces rimosus]KEF22345.1 hypothetical protein DF18_03230 [Streptomyces rimosus]KOT35405.1 hypothetical protein ADK42_20670 [Streptomyces rimosus subsp. rimosus]